MRNSDTPTNVAPRAAAQLPRREFLKYSIGTIALASAGPLTTACSSSGGGPTYRISSDVATTLDRMISFPLKTGLTASDLQDVAAWEKLGYGQWSLVAASLPLEQRVDLMPAGYSNRLPTHKGEWLNFFAFTDIHVTDKESPAQLLYLKKTDAFHDNDTSIYSPVMTCTTHVLDAAIQTVNALHKVKPMDFGISLGDTCNCAQYNELRWYIDVIDGGFIEPSSGAHVGAYKIDYQMPYRAAGLDKAIHWYQAIGNHDHFFIGSIPVDADPSMGLRAAYGGVIDGSSRNGNIIKCGLVTDPAFAKGPPKVVADPNRRSLLRTEWIEEYFNTRTEPVGHGFGLVDPARRANGFACYSFVPKAGVPLKVIVLDDTQSEHDGSKDIHGHGYLDAERWAWLQAELAAGQVENQLMIIAAHIPIAVSGIGSETEWWLGEATTTTEYRNAVTIEELVATLQGTTNLIMWIAGHRHLNVVKALPSADAAHLEQGFWQVETSSLRDFPQQFRTFEVYLNSDYTVSVVTVNVDPAVAHGAPAAKSRAYAVAAQQIVGTNLHANNNNVQMAFGNRIPQVQNLPVPTMDPTRLQDNTTDLSIRWVDLSHQGVPFNASYNAELIGLRCHGDSANRKEPHCQPTVSTGEISRGYTLSRSSAHQS